MLIWISPYEYHLIIFHTWSWTDLQYGVKLDLEFEVRLWLDNGPLEGFLQGLYTSLSCLTQLGDTHVLSLTPQSLVLSLVHLRTAKTDRASFSCLVAEGPESNTYATRTPWITNAARALTVFSYPIMIRMHLATWRYWGVNIGLHCYL